MKVYNKLLLAILAIVLVTSTIFIGYSKYNKEEVEEEPQVVLVQDKKSPEVILDKEIRIKQDDSFVIEDYCKVLDLSDVFTTISGQVDTNTVGSYPINITVTDEFGNMALAKTLVIVEPVEEEIEEAINKVNNNTNNSAAINREVNHTNDSGVSPPASQEAMGGSTQTTQPEYKPPYIPEVPNRGPYIDGVRDISISINTSINDLVFMLSGGVSASGSVSIDFTSVNTSVPGAYSVYYYGSDGASASCTVIVYE